MLSLGEDSHRRGIHREIRGIDREWYSSHPIALSHQLMLSAENTWIDEARIREFAQTLSVKKAAFWGKPYLTCADGFTPEQVFTYALAVTSLNFCFWNPEGSQEWNVLGKRGANALTAGFERGWAAGLPLDRPGFLANLDKHGLVALLDGDRGHPQLPPLAEDRLIILNEVGEFLEENPARDLLRGFDDAFDLARYLGANLGGFRDVTEDLPGLDGERLPFLKKAQLFTSAAKGLLGKEAPAWLLDTSRLSAFADYRVPQILRKLGLIHYSESLAQKVDNQELIPAESEAEIEIRAASIAAVDLVAQAARGDWTSCDLDAIFWLAARGAKEIQPFHRTLTTWY